MRYFMGIADSFLKEEQAQPVSWLLGFAEVTFVGDSNLGQAYPPNLSPTDHSSLQQPRFLILGNPVLKTK